MIQSETDFNDWLIKFESVDVDRQVEKFNSITQNIMDNFIRKKVITVDDREPIWVMIIIIKVKEKKITRGMLKTPMTLLSFPRFTIQAKNRLILLETNITCNFQTN